MTMISYVSGGQTKTQKGTQGTPFWWKGQELSLYQDEAGRQLSWIEVTELIQADMRASGIVFNSMSAMGKNLPMYIFKLQSEITDLKAQLEARGDLATAEKKKK